MAVLTDRSDATIVARRRTAEIYASGNVVVVTVGFQIENVRYTRKLLGPS